MKSFCAANPGRPRPGRAIQLRMPLAAGTNVTSDNDLIFSVWAERVHQRVPNLGPIISKCYSEVSVLNRVQKTSLHLAFFSVCVNIFTCSVSGMLILHHCFSTWLAAPFQFFLSEAASSFPTSILLVSDCSSFICALSKTHLLSSFHLIPKVRIWGLVVLLFLPILWESERSRMSERWVACLLPAEAQTSKGSWEEGPLSPLAPW